MTWKENEKEAMKTKKKDNPESSGLSFFNGIYNFLLTLTVHHKFVRRVLYMAV